MALHTRRISLRGADLRDVSLGEVSLAGADLRGADLRGVDLVRRDLREADLRGADLRGAHLAGADLRDAELDGARLDGADVTDADLRRTRAHGMSGEDLQAGGVRLDGAEWRDARLRGARLTGARGAGWRLDRAELDGASLVGAYLPRAVFDDTNLEGTDLGGARLVDAAFAGARGRPSLLDADLRGADLRDVLLEDWLPERLMLGRARLSYGAARAHRERLGALGWVPSPSVRLALVAGAAVRGWEGPARALVQDLRESRARRVAERDSRAAAVAERRRVVEERREARRRPAPLPVEAPPPVDAPTLLGRINAVAGRARSLGRVVMGDGEGNAAPAVEDILDYQLEMVSRDRVFEGANATRDDLVRLAARRERAQRRRIAERRAAERARVPEVVRGVDPAPAPVLEAASALREDAQAARRAREAAGVRAAEEAWIAVELEEEQAPLHGEGPVVAVDRRVAAPWAVEQDDRDGAELLVGEEADDALTEAEVLALAPLPAALEVSTPSVREAARAAAEARARAARSAAVQVARAAEARLAAVAQARRAAEVAQAEALRTASAAQATRAAEARAAEAAAIEIARLERARDAEARSLAAAAAAAEAARVAAVVAEEAAEAARVEAERVAATQAAEATRVEAERVAAIEAAAEAARVEAARVEAERVAAIEAAAWISVDDAPGRGESLTIAEPHDARLEAPDWRGLEVAGGAARVGIAHPSEEEPLELGEAADDGAFDAFDDVAAFSVSSGGPRSGAFSSDAHATVAAVRILDQARIAAEAEQARIAAEAEQARIAAEARENARLAAEALARQVARLAAEAEARVADRLAAELLARAAERAALAASAEAALAADAAAEREAERRAAEAGAVEAEGRATDADAAREAEAQVADLANREAARVAIEADAGVATASGILSAGPAEVAVPARADRAPALGAARRISAVVVQRAWGLTRAAAGGLARAVPLLASLTLRAGRFLLQQVGWMGAVAWRVVVAGVARGLPAAWRALALEATAGTDAPSAEESVDFRVESVARERLLARQGLLRMIATRRHVARHRLHLGRERDLLEQRAREALPVPATLVAARIAAARLRQQEAGLAAAREAEAARAARVALAAELRTRAERTAARRAEARAEAARREAARAAEARAEAERLTAARPEDDEPGLEAPELSLVEDASDAPSVRVPIEFEPRPVRAPRARVERPAGARSAPRAARLARGVGRALGGLVAAGPALAGWVASRLARRPSAPAVEEDPSVLVPIEFEPKPVRAPRPPRPKRPPAPPRAPRVVTGPSVFRRVSDALAEGAARFRPPPPPPPLVMGPGVSLVGARLDERDLGGVDLRGADLHGASLVGTNLRGARLAGADLRDADLTDAVLAGADLTGARLDGACFDQAVMDNVVLDDARLVGARFVSARGLAPGLRVSLGERGADVGLDEDGRWVRVGSMAVAVSVVSVMALYLVVRFAGTTLDRAALEEAAAESQRSGDQAAAAEQFAALAQQSEDQGARVNFLLEAAAAAEEAGDVEQAMDLLDEAASAAKDTGAEARVRLRRAATYRRVDLADSAAAEYRGVLAELDLTPTEQAEAITGLSAVDEDFDAVAEEDRLLTAAATDLERGALALALADGWASVGKLDVARAVLERALDQIAVVEEAVPARLRLARLLGESGDADAALDAFEALLQLPGDLGAEARLGAADLRARRGEDTVAFSLLEPLLARGDDDLGARGRYAAANIASRGGDDSRAIGWLQEILGMDDVEPRMADEARLLLARLLVRTDPEAAARLVDANPALREELLLGQARSLREAGKRMDARALWVQVAEDESAGEEARADAELSLAELQVEEGDAEGALRRYERVMAAAEGVAVRQRVVLGLCNALVRLGKLQEAEAKYDALLASNPSAEVAAQAGLGLARTAELRGQTDRATRRYLELGKDDGPWAVEALDGLGQLRERTGDLAGAAEAWRLARARTTGEAERRTQIEISLARVLDALGDPGAAAAYEALLEAPDPTVRVQARIAVADGIIGSDPARARAYFEEAAQMAEAGEARAAARAGWLRASVAVGDLDGGVARIRAWLETETDEALRGELAVAATQALRAEGRLDLAVTIAETYAADGGFELGMHRAGALRELGRGADAAAVLRTLRPASAEDEVWRVETLGEASIEAGDLDGASSTYDRLATLPGGAAAASFGRARLARERGAYSEALELLSSSEDERAPMERATVLEGLGKMDEAETAWDRIAMSPDLEQRSAGVLGLARVRLSRDDAAGALAELDALPVPAEGFLLTAAQVRAEALLALGRHDEAGAVYKALDRDAESRVVGALGLGEVALAQDDARAAVLAFQRSWDLTVDPYYQALALSGLARAHAESGAAVEARAALARLRRDFPARADAIAAAEAVVEP